MIVEAQKRKNGIFIPMTGQFKGVRQGRILLEAPQGCGGLVERTHFLSKKQLLPAHIPIW